MTIDEVCRLLAAECYSAGSQREWARQHGFSPSYVSAVLQKRKLPSSRMLKTLGLERVERRVTSYRRAGK